jgi:hypothetical protein
MRQAFMSQQKGMIIYIKDMTLNEQHHADFAEPGDPGPRRRR